MKLSVQVIVDPDDDGEGTAVVREVFAVDRDGLAPDTLGLQLFEAQDLLVAVQDTMVAQQVQRAVAAQVGCPYCGKARRHKDTRTIVVRSLFGTLRLASLRWWHCPCAAAPTRTFVPWPPCCPIGPPRSWPTCRPASPGSSPTGCRRSCWASCCHWDGACTPPWYAAGPTLWPSGWKTNSATSAGATSHLPA